MQSQDKVSKIFFFLLKIHMGFLKVYCASLGVVVAIFLTSFGISEGARYNCAPHRALLCSLSE